MVDELVRRGKNMLKRMGYEEYTISYELAEGCSKEDENYFLVQKISHQKKRFNT